MAWMYVLGPCIACGQPFYFSAERVPSIRVQGEREPVCRDCMDALNDYRRRHGLEPFQISPGAYEPDETL